MNVRRFLSYAGVLGLGLAGLTALWEKTQSVDPAVTAQYESSLRELQRLDRTLNQDVLRARFQLINTYDPLVASRNHITSTRKVVGSTPGFLSESDAAALGEQIASYGGVIDAKTSLIETFKSRNSVLKNSLRYVPTVASEVADAADVELPGSGLGADIRALLNDVLVYNLTSDESLAPKLVESVAALRPREEGLSAATARKFRLVLAHVSKIAEAKPVVDSTVRSIFDVPVVAHEESVSSAFRAGVGSAEEEANGYRTLLYAASIGMAGLVAFAFTRLNKALGALAEANATLEQKVTDRTAALDGRNHAMRLVLDNVEQGFVVVSRDGKLAVERSAALDRWIPPSNVGATPTVWDWVGSADPRAAEWLKLAWEDLCAEVLPFEILVDQLPKRIALGEMHLGLELRPLRDAAGEITSVLLVVSDITERVARERAEAEGRDLLNVIEHMMHDRNGFLEFVDEAEQIVERVGSGRRNRVEIFRDVHTLKGNAGIFGISTVAGVCHTLETALVDGEGDITPEQRARLQDAWSSFNSKIAPILGASDEKKLEITSAELATLRASIQAGASPSDLDTMVTRLEQEPAERRLERFGRQAVALGSRLGKGDVQVHIEGNEVRFERDRYNSFWASFVHVLRNAVDHGLEDSADDRIALGKAPQGDIWLSASEEPGSTVVEVRDNGRGIDWERIRERATKLGIPANTANELSAAVFADGLSTKDEVSDVSGRGVGMGAVRRSVEDLGGSVEIESEVGRGTVVRFRFPKDAEQMAA